MLKLKIITPERIMLEIQAESVTLPTVLGEITVLPKHLPLVANLAAGVVKYKAAGGDKFFAVSGGVVEISPKGEKKITEVVVLADTAEFGAEIDLDRAEEAKQRAQKIMQQSYLSEKNYADAVAGLEKHLARIKTARKHRTKR